MKAFSAEPGNRDIGQTKVGGNQQWVVSAPMKPDRDRIWLNTDMRGAVDQVSENMSGFGRLVSVSDPLAQQAIKT